MTPTPRGDQVSRRTRTIRYGASILLVLVGVVCGIAISGSAGGTLATVFVGIGLVGVVSLIFYEVGLTEDRERRGPLGDPPEPARRPPDEGTDDDPPRSAADPHGTGHQAQKSARYRPDGMRRQRRRLH